MDRINHDPISHPSSSAGSADIFLQNLPKPHQQREQVKTIGALGRILPEDIISPETSLPFTSSVMDGYAVHVADTFGVLEQK